LLHRIQEDEELCKRMRVVVERKDVIYNIDINNLHLE
ncbi:MAG: HAD-IB family hydrolase, partial [Solobacterium sp.]|nr:HAD-IB family hydrolase [Solobacterium sp.]